LSRKCPICESWKAISLHHQEFEMTADSPLPRSYDVVACSTCSFVFADSSGIQRDYSRYYEEQSKYEDPRIASGGGDSQLDRDRLAITANLVARLVNAPDKSSKIVDIGCANGGLLDAMKALGFVALTGVDRSEACVQRVRTRGHTSISADVTDLAKLGDSGAYDVAVLSHVLEHVVDVRGAVVEVSRQLADDGVIYVEVPDAARYVQHPFVPFYYFDSEHINHFDADSLTNLAAATGHRIVAQGERELFVGNRHAYPAVWVALSVSRGKCAQLSPTLRLRDKVADYIALSKAQARYPALQELADTQTRVLLWGAGSHAQRLLKESPLANCKIVEVVDSDRVKQGRKIIEREIADPNSGLKNVSPDVVIVIACVLHAEGILRDLRERQIANRVVLAN
jgi:2-polyprenyl-3-methyl-5-hydroxy-6-metoxy-1,4-benzoquinol methylase